MAGQGRYIYDGTGKAGATVYPDGTLKAGPTSRLVVRDANGDEVAVVESIDNIAASQTDDAFVALEAAKVIVVHSLVVTGDATGGFSLTTKPAGAGTAITPVFDLVAGTPFILPFNERGWFRTTAGEGLSVTTIAGAGIGIYVQTSKQ